MTFDWQLDWHSQHTTSKLKHPLTGHPVTGHRVLPHERVFSPCIPTRKLFNSIITFYLSKLLLPLFFSPVPTLYSDVFV